MPRQFPHRQRRGIVGSRLRDMYLAWRIEDERLGVY
jgi:hypothetical protein